MGAYHTIDLELNRKFTLSKDHWDFVALERIGELQLVVRCDGLTPTVYP
jgi:stalled ribosome rescue protein Dom34